MVKIIKYIAPVLLSIFASTAITQTSTPAENLKKSIKEIGSLFKKKKKDSTATAAVTTSNSSTTGSYTLQAGGLAASVKYLDADQIFSFNAGAARIRKGNSSALIDSAGNFIVPYNTYDFAELFVAGPVGYNVHYNGIYRYNNLDHNWGCYINTKGRVILKTGLNTNVTDYTDNKQLLQTNNSSHNAIYYTYTTQDGKAYTSNQIISYIIDSIGIVRGVPGSPGQYAYRKLTGEVIASGFDDASPFSDGMARVGKNDQFGRLKYGYINRKGKLVIPFSFSVVPANFTGGFAKVQPQDKSAFEYAFINKAGEIVFKQTTEDIAKNGVFDHFTNFGLAFSEKTIIDTTFKIVAKADFFKAFGLPADSWLVSPGNYTDGETNPKLVFSTRTARSPYTQQPVYGFINLTSKKVVLPMFDFMNISGSGLYFDPVSHLAYAKVITGKDKNNVLVYREGYINEDGQFVLVKGAVSQW